MTATARAESLRGRAREAANWQAVLRTATVFVVVGVVWVIFANLSPFFFTEANLLNLSIQASNIAIIAAGLTVVLIVAEIDLSIGAVQALAGSAAAVLVIQQGVPVPIGIVAALAIGAVVGVVNGLMTWKLEIPSFIGTLAMLGVAQGIAFLLTNNTPINGFPSAYLTIGTGRVAGIPVAAIIALATITCVHVLLYYTRLGRHIFAVGGNASSAELTGIRVGRVKLIALAISGITAGIGGLILSARLNAGAGGFGTGDLLPAVAAVVIGGTSLFGGVGSVWGTLAGVILLASITNGLILVDVQDYWQQIAVGGMIVGAMLLDRLLKGQRFTWRGGKGRRVA